ncbi:MAG: hypothetical protein WD598_15330 [Acidimicrobiia bacterium]
MADDTEQADATETTPPKEPGAGVQLPAWLAGALVVVLALAIGGVGYAIGDDGSGSPSLDPIANLNGAPNDPSECVPGGPGGFGGPGGQRRPDGPRDERGNPDEPAEPHDDTPDEEESNFSNA